MSTNTGDLYVNIRADISELKKGLKQANKSLNGFDREFKKSNRNMERFKKQTADASKTLMKFAGAYVGLSKIGGVIKGIIEDSFNFNREMEKAEVKLKTMISATKGYTLVTGELASAQKRNRLIMKETGETMRELEKINSQTAYGMSELIDNYALMKPSFDDANVSMKDQVEILKLVMNTASTFGLASNEIATGIDDLAKGTYKTTQSFGKMMTAIGVTREEIKNTADIVGYLKTKMQETGKAQDTYAVATSNLRVAYLELIKDITKPHFEKLKNSMKTLTKLMGKDGVLSTKAFGTAFQTFATTSVKLIGFMLKAVNQLVTAIQTAWKGYQQLGNLAGMAGNKLGKEWNALAVNVGDFFGMDTTQDKKDLEAYNSALNERKQIMQRLTNETHANFKAMEDIDGAINEVVASYVEYESQVKDVKNETGQLVELTKDIKTPTASKTKAKKTKKDIKKETDEVAREFKRTMGDMFDALFNGDMVGTFQAGMDAIRQHLSLDTMSDAWGNFFDGMVNGFEDFSKSMDAIINSSVWGILLTVGSSLLSSFMGGGAVTPPKLTDMKVTSDSLENALKDIYNVNEPLLQLTRDMRYYLENISNAFAGIENSLLRSGIDLGGKMFQESSKSGFLFGGSVKSLHGTSIEVGASTVADLMNGEISAMFETVIKKVRTTWYGKKKTKFYHEYQDISDQIAGYMAEATESFFKSFQDIGKALGISTAGLAGAKIDLGKFDTTGMTSAEVSAELQGRFSAELDAIAETLFAPVKEFQRAGEGIAETAYRVTKTFDQVSHALKGFDKSVTWQTANIIADYAGGLDALTTALADYDSGFFTEQEQIARMNKNLSASFKTLGLTMPKNNDEFRKMVEGIDTASRSGAKLFGEVITLAGGFNEMTERVKAIDEEILQGKMDIANAELGFFKDILSKIQNAFTGSLSYLSTSEKALYLGNTADSLFASGDNAGGLDALKNQLSYSMKMSRTKEEYIPKFNAYVEKLAEQQPEKTTDDVVNTLDKIYEKIKDVTTAITSASYQAPLTNGGY